MKLLSMNIITWKSVCYSVTNKYYFINFPIPKYSFRIKFYIS